MNNYPIREAEPCFQYLINRIAKRAGLETEVEVYACDAPAACGTLFIKGDDGKMKAVICYNPVFVDSIQRRYSSSAVVVVFALEMARFYNNRLAEMNSGMKLNNNNHCKINADEFAGWVLWHESIALKDAMKIYELPKFRKINALTGKNERKLAMKEGWVQAHNRLLLPPKTDAEFSLEERKAPEQILDIKETNDENETGNIVISLAAFALLSGLGMLSGKS